MPEFEEMQIGRLTKRDKSMTTDPVLVGVIAVQLGLDLDDAVEELSDDLLAVLIEGSVDLGEGLLGGLVYLSLRGRAVARVLQEGH